MTDTKLKDVCDIVDCGTAACCYVSVCMCLFTKVLGSFRGVSFELLLDDSRAVACIQCRVPRFNSRPSDRSSPPHGSGCAVPRIGMWRTADRDVPCRGSGCAVPRIGMCCAVDRNVPCRGSGCAVPRIGMCRAADRDVLCRGSGCGVPRIGMCRAADRDVAYRGSGCAVPRIGMCCAVNRDVPCSWHPELRHPILDG